MTPQPIFTPALPEGWVVKSSAPEWMIRERQITCMLRMRQIVGVIVIAGFVKGKRTVAIFMDVQGIELAVWRYILMRKSVDFHFYQNAAKGSRIEVSDTLQTGVICIAG